MSEAKPNDKRLKRQLSLVQQYKDLFESPSGKKVLHDLIKQTGMLDTSHANGDSHATAFNEGARGVCLYILKRLNTSESDLFELIKKGKTYEHELFAEDSNVT
jgi:hypothetical protein